MKTYFLLLIPLMLNSCLREQTPDTFPDSYDVERPIFDYKGDSVGIHAVKDNHHLIQIKESKFWTTLKQQEIANLEQNRLYQINRAVGKSNQKLYLEIRNLKGKQIFNTNYFNPIFKSSQPGIRITTAPNGNILLWGTTDDTGISKEHILMLNKNGKTLLKKSLTGRENILYYPTTALNNNDEFAVCYIDEHGSYLKNWIIRRFSNDGELLWEKSMRKTEIIDIAIANDGKIALLEDADITKISKQKIYLLDEKGDLIMEKEFDFNASNICFPESTKIRIYTNYFRHHANFKDIKI